MGYIWNKNLANISRIRKINDTDFLLKDIKGAGIGYGFQFYGGNRQALTGKGDNKTFEDLADNTYFGVLRMDVDNLSKIFIKGLPEEAKSFAAYATLSFLLDYFFSGYLNTIRKRDEFKDDVNILYSGGDDVFAVGRWDKLILFAQEIRAEFQRFVGREDISVSGGMAIVGEKFPIAKAAEMAGEAEHKAKSLPDKNAFNLFGETFSWKDEYKYIKTWKDEFVRLCAAKEKPMPRSILHKVMRFAELLKAGDMKYAWHTVYFLKRFSDGKSETVKSFCDKLQNEVLSSKRNYELMAIAARWAELELRDKNNSNNLKIN
jgi:CRISPR-associated protein Csm1